MAVSVRGRPLPPQGTPCWERLLTPNEQSLAHLLAHVLCEHRLSISRKVWAGGGHGRGNQTELRPFWQQGLRRDHTPGWEEATVGQLWSRGERQGENPNEPLHFVPL